MNANAATTAPADSARTNRGSFRGRITYAPMTPTAMTAASGRYIRCSAAISVTIGITLDVGARMPNNQAPANPIGIRRTSAQIVTAMNANNITA